MFLTKGCYSLSEVQSQLINYLADLTTRAQDPLRPRVSPLTGLQIAECVESIVAPLVRKKREADLDISASPLELKQLLDQLRQQEEARRRGENGNSFADAPAASPKAPLPAAPVAKAPTVARAAKAPPVAETARQAAPPTDRRAALAKAAAAEMQTAFARANAKPVEKRLHVLVAR